MLLLLRSKKYRNKGMPMKKSYRVKKEKEFQQVFNKKQSCANRRFVVYVLEKPQQAHFQWGFLLGRKLETRSQEML